MGPHLTSTAPEAAPDAVSAGYAATLKSEQLPQRSSRLSFVGGVTQFSESKPDSNSTILSSGSVDEGLRYTQVSSGLSAP
jgi:hypothetical protein